MRAKPSRRPMEPAVILKFVKHYQKDLEKGTNDDSRIIHCIEKLFQLPVTIQLLQDTGVGRTVNALRKKEGEVSTAARALVAKWKQVVAEEEEEIERNKPIEVNESDDDHGSLSPNEEDIDRSENSYGYQNSPKSDSPDYKSKSRDENKVNYSKEHIDNHRDRQNWNDDDDRNRQKLQAMRHDKISRPSKNLSDSSDDNENSEDNNRNSDDSDEENNNRNNSVSRLSNSGDIMRDKSDENENHSDLRESESESEHHNHIALSTSYQSTSDSKKYSSTSNQHIDKHSHRDSNSHKYSSDSHRHKSTKSDHDRHQSSKESSKHNDSTSYRSQHDMNKIASFDPSSSLKPSTSNTNKSSDPSKSSHHKKHSSKHSSSKEQKSEKERHKEKPIHNEIKEKDYEKSSSSRDKHSKKEKHSSSERSHKDKSKHSSGHKEKHSESKSKKQENENKSTKHKSSKASNGEYVKEDSTKRDEKRESSEHRKRDHKGEPKKDSSQSTSKSSKSSKSDKYASKSKTRDPSDEYVPEVKRKKTYGDIGDGIDGESGASFAEALGMISPSKSSLNQKKKSSSQSSKQASIPIEIHSDSSNDRCKSPENLPSLLLKSSIKLSPLPPLKISVSALPEISPNYVPRPPPRLIDNPTPSITEEEAMKVVMNNKNQRTKVFSGNKSIYGPIPSLYDLCVFVLQENINALEYTGGVPYEIIKPVVDKATPEQLFVLEHYNPYLMEDTDPLWQIHCNKKFRNKQRQEMETWREMYMRCSDEQEAKLKSLTANIKLQQDKSQPVRQTKMAFVDSTVKPPRSIARKQAIYGTARKAVASPAARVPSLANNTVFNATTAIGAGSSTAPTRTSSFIKPKKAPLMAKALQFMKGRNKR